MRLSHHRIGYPYTLFQSTHPLRDTTWYLKTTMSDMDISIHAPLTGCDIHNSLRISFGLNFNPRTPYGMRLYLKNSLMRESRFQSTHPLRDATMDAWTPTKYRLFQSTHPLRDATYWYYSRTDVPKISIHAPLTGCDDYCNKRYYPHQISIHAPLTGCDVAGHRHLDVS